MSHTPAALSASRRAPRRSALAALLALALLLSVAGIPGTSVAGGTPAASSAVLDGSALSADRTSRADGAALPQLDPGLEGIVGLAGAADESGARTLAEALDVEYEDGRVTVVLEVEAGQHERVRAALGSVHAEETGAYEDLIRAEVPVGSLRALARAEGVRVVRPPMRPQIASGDAAAQVGRPDRGPVTVSKDGETLEVPSGLRPASLQAPAGRPATDPDIEAQSITYFSHGFEAWPGPWAVWSEGGGPGWGRTTYRSSEGSYSAYCAGSSIAPPGPYANNMHSWMWTATPVNLSTATRAYLVFDVWTDLEAGWDDLFVGVSFDDEDYEGYNMYANSGGWTTVVYDLSDIYRDGSISYVGRPQVYIAAVFTSDASIVKEGGYIDNIRIVDTPPSLMSQGVSETNATALHAEGIDGSGTKVGVIDVGFWGYEYLLGTELPDAVQTWGGGSLGPEGTGIFEEHGTAVAEVVYDMAPGAELYLAQIADEIDFGNAAAWMTANGVDAVNASLGWFEGPRDGTDTLNDVVSATVAGDAFWAQAAGNSREEHWSGDWTALNGYLQWSSGTNIQRFEGSAGARPSRI